MREHAESVRILAVAGSLRRRSYNRALLEAAAGLAPAGMAVSVYEGLGDVPPLDEDLSDAPDQPAGVARLRMAMRAADGLLIATPEYNQSIPGVLKNVIDWLSLSEPGDGLEGRPVAVTGVTTGPWGTRLAQTMVRQILVSTHAILLPAPMLYLREAASLFDETGRLVDGKTRDRLGDLLAAFGDWVRLISSRPEAQAV